jgi:hypothetical protein
MSDMSTIISGDPDPPTTVPIAPTVPHPAPANRSLPQGAHPLDKSVPTVPGQMVDTDKVAAEGDLGAQGQRRKPPWDTENEQAVPVYQRAAHDWSANQYTLSAKNIIQIAGRLRGCLTTVVWVPTAAASGCVISPDEGDITQGAGVTLSPGDSIELPTEGPVWAGVIDGNANGTVYVARFFNPPGGGLGLSSA